MKQNKQLTPILKKESVRQDWFVLDANGKTLGRFACEVAKILRGKHKATYTPHVDSGDGVVIINAEKIRVTGAKAAQKIYRYYTGYMSGMREIPFKTLLARKPAYILEQAVKGMMPSNRLTSKQLRRLRIFAGDKHDMQPQQPVVVNV